MWKHESLWNMVAIIIIDTHMCNQQREIQQMHQYFTKYTRIYHDHDE